MGGSIAAAIGKKLKNPFKPFGSGGGKNTKEALGRIEGKLDTLSSGIEAVGNAATTPDPESGVAGEGVDPTQETFDEGTQDAAGAMYGSEEERLAASQASAASINAAATGVVGATSNISGL